MFRKFVSFNLFISLIFLVTILFPTSIFSYEKTHYKPNHYFQDGKVNESLGYEPVIFKKVRCPRCGMEFYYVPGKESPHAHWVHYEVPKEEKSENKEDREAILVEKQGEKSEKGLLMGLISKNKKDKGDIEDILSEKDEKGLDIDKLSKFKTTEYELRQKLTCPYDGYSFFPEGEIIEERKLMLSSLVPGRTSIIETSFSNWRDLGYLRKCIKGI